MSITVHDTPISGLKVVEHQVFGDHRGFFFEVWNRDRFAQHGLPTEFVQANHSSSSRGVVRGLHFQYEPPMGKLMRVTRGEAFLVAVDIRFDSPTRGKWHAIRASEDNKLQFWGGAGFARGFCALSEICEVQYLCTGTYNSKGESGVLWNDPEIGVEWPVEGEPTLSDKDRNAQTLAQWFERPEARLFKMD